MDIGYTDRQNSDKPIVRFLPPVVLCPVMEVIYGVNPVLEALRSGRRPVERISIAQGARIGRFEELMAAARASGVPVARQPSAALDRAAHGRPHQGVVA